MIKKVYTKEQRYIMKMEAEGFQRKNFWVHVDDHEKIKRYVNNLRAKRMAKKT